MTVVLILAACAVAALLGYGNQALVPDLDRKPVPFHGGTDSPDDFAAALKDDAREWAAILREKVMAGTAARPGATVVQFPGATS